MVVSGEWTEQQVPVAPDGTFAIHNWLCEDDALIAFSGTKGNSGLLNIRISTQLDSSYQPTALAGRAFYIGEPPAAVRQTLNQPLETSAAVFTDEGSLLPAVVVSSTAKSPAQQFDEEHASGLFRSGGQRLLSVMDDPGALGFHNVFSSLQGRVAGLQIARAGFNGGAARWRGSPVTFFLDEVRVSSQQIASIPMTDIAIIKAYPPPFIGAPGGGGAVAIYTRRGGETLSLTVSRITHQLSFEVGKGLQQVAMVIGVTKGENNFAGLDCFD